MSAMARRHRSEQRRLLGLRRVVHYTMASEIGREWFVPAVAGTILTHEQVAMIEAGILPKVAR